MKRYQLLLAISAEDYLAYYRGTAKQVIAKDINGRVIKFPAQLLQTLVTTNGIHGRFELSCDDDFTNARLQRFNGRPRDSLN